MTYMKKETIEETRRRHTPSGDRHIRIQRQGEVMPSAEYEDSPEIDRDLKLRQAALCALDIMHPGVGTGAIERHRENLSRPYHRATGGLTAKPAVPDIGSGFEVKSGSHHLPMDIGSVRIT